MWFFIIEIQCFQLWIRKLRWWLCSSPVLDLPSVLLSIRELFFLGFMSHVRHSNRETSRVKCSDPPLKLSEDENATKRERCCLPPGSCQVSKGSTVSGGAEHVTTHEAVAGENQGKMREHASL